ncbi:MAG: hypothetical protein MUO82_06105 [Candidatus Thermoplasmatota archaeon]|nr:hypothetical protein [Candidatus Thermoplasmatota archaeon]
MFKKNRYERVGYYKKILNEKDAFDKEILNLINNKELSVGIVEIKEPKYDTMYNINLDSLSKNERPYFIKEKKLFKYNIKQ